jgi:hypothetical protein
MNETPNHPHDHRDPRRKEYEDPHYHDDDDIVPADDVDHPGHRPPVRRKPGRRLPPRRHYEE